MNVKGTIAVAVLLNAAILPGVIAQSAQSHPPSTYFGGNAKWVSNSDVYYNIDDSMNPSNTDGAVTTADDKWSDRANGKAPNFIYAGPAALNGPYDACNGPTAVFRANLGPAQGFDGYPGAATFLCHRDGNLVDWSLVLSDYASWQFDSGPPTSTQLDGRSFLTHEFGHAAGWTGHFPQTGDVCQQGAGDPTMCRAWEPGTPVEWRTLEDHDIHTINDAYN